MRADSTWDKELDKFSLGVLKKNNGRSDCEKLQGRERRGVCDFLLITV